MSVRIYGHRLLKTLPGLATRPTASKVRQALFNVWQGKIEGCRWLDLCAGNGTLGAEALCRGASRVVAIENSAAVCALLRTNWQPLVQSHQSIEIIRCNVLQLYSHLEGQSFDRIYFDPPYHSGLYEPVLAAIARQKLLAPYGAMAIEHDENFKPPLIFGELEQRDQKKYGKTRLSFYRLLSE